MLQLNELSGLGYDDDPGSYNGHKKDSGPYFGHRTVKLGLIPDTRQPSPVITAILNLIVDCENLQGPYVAHRAAS